MALPTQLTADMNLVNAARHIETYWAANPSLSSTQPKVKLLQHLDNKIYLVTKDFGLALGKDNQLVYDYTSVIHVAGVDNKGTEKGATYAITRSSVRTGSYFGYFTFYQTRPDLHYVQLPKHKALLVTSCTTITGEANKFAVEALLPVITGLGEIRGQLELSNLAAS